MTIFLAYRDKVNTMNKIKVVALDLDGTITQHRSYMIPANRAALDRLREKYTLVMVGAGNAPRIFSQMEHYPIDIIGNYGMQFGVYNAETDSIDFRYDIHTDCDRESVSKRVEMLRLKYGFTEYAGDSVEFHDSGCVTFPLIGKAARIEDKLVFDPDRKKRLAIYDDVCRVFNDYTVFIGGSSSFDLVPAPYNKYYALDKYCRDHGLVHDEVVYVGDDCETGGGDRDVFISDIRCIRVDSYLNFEAIITKELL